MIRDGQNEPDEEKPQFPEDAKPWHTRIEQAAKAFDTWFDRSDKIRKQHADVTSGSADSGKRRYNVLWANTQVLRPAIYARAPTPEVVPRHKDRKELPRKAAEMLERTIATGFELEDVHDVLIHCRNDLALVGRGTPWARYVADQTEVGLDEKVVWDHIKMRDFLHEPGRDWKEVGWVARRVFLDRQAGMKRFSDKWNADIEYRDTEDTSDEYKVDKKAEVWEIWDKTAGLVYWVHKNKETFLDVREPWLDLKGFFPCPRPAYATVEDDTLIPVPDFLYYKDQAEEINILTDRIASLGESLRLKGFYPAGAEDASEAIELALKQTDNRATLVPVPSLAALGAGGIGGMIEWLPIKEVVETIMACVQLRQQLMEDVREIAGISDIMRGDTDAQETLGAQQLKAQYGSSRVRDKQDEMVRLARDMCRISGEIMAENFQPETFQKMAQMDDLPRAQQIQQQMLQLQQQPPQVDPNNPQVAQQAQAQMQQQLQELQNTVTLEAVIQMIQNERIRPFVLEIETDSTIQPDEQAEKASRAEFLQAMSQTMQNVAPMAMQGPAEAKFAGEVIKFSLAPYRIGRTLDQAVDDLVESVTEKAKQGPPPNPEAEAKKAEVEMAKEKHQGEMQARQIEGQTKQMEAQARQQEIAAKAEADAQIRQMDVRLKEIELLLKEKDIEIAELKIEHEKARPKPQPPKTNGSGDASSASM